MNGADDKLRLEFCEPFVVTSRLSLSRSKSDQSAYLMLSEAAQLSSTEGASTIRIHDDGIDV